MKLQRFKYKAKDLKGKLLEGEVEANSVNHAAKLIRQRGLIIIALNSKRDLSIGFIKAITQRVTTKDVTNITRQLSTMINAGLPLTEALVILRAQSKGVMQNIVSQILADVEEGQSLSTALSKYEKIFGKTYIALVKSGEIGGVLDEVLARLAENLEKREEFKGKVKGALIYPVIVVGGMILVALIMMIFVIPRMLALYQQFDAELPFATQILISISKFMSAYWYFMFAAFGALVWGFKVYKKTPKGRKKIDEMIFKIPIVGELQRQIILTDLTRTMSLMVGSGVSILETLNISSEVVGNSVIGDALKDTSTKVEKGFPLTFAFSRHPEAFPFILAQMIAVGEETGQLDEVLAKVSHVFEVESDQKVKALTAAIEPIILVFLGIGVAFLVISVILPIYNLTTQL